MKSKAASGIMLLLLVSVFLFHISSVKAGIPVYQDWESGFNSWSASETDGGHNAITSTFPHRGQFSLQTSVNQTGIAEVYASFGEWSEPVDYKRLILWIGNPTENNYDGYSVNAFIRIKCFSYCLYGGGVRDVSYFLYLYVGDVSQADAWPNEYYYDWMFGYQHLVESYAFSIGSLPQPRSWMSLKLYPSDYLPLAELFGDVSPRVTYTYLEKIEFGVVAGYSNSSKGHIDVCWDDVQLDDGLLPTTVCISPSTNTAPVGYNFTIDVSVGDIPRKNPMFAWQIKLAYNYTVLECADIQEGEFLRRNNENATWIPNSEFSEAGEILSYCGLSADSPGVWGTGGRLMTIIFKVLQNGTSQLDLTEVWLCDTNLEDIPFTSQNGVFYDPPFTGDVNGDRKVDGKDVAIAAKAFGSYVDHSRWNPVADVNNDGRIDGKDIVLVAKNFGKTYP